MDPLSEQERIELVEELIQPGGGSALYMDLSGDSPKGLGESAAFNAVFGSAVKDTLKRSSHGSNLVLRGAFGLTAAAVRVSS